MALSEPNFDRAPATFGSDLRASILDAPLIVVSAGRCGSTLLMRVLNSIDGVYVFGEHGGAFRYLRGTIVALGQYKSYQSTNADLILSKSGTDDQFIGWATPFTDLDCLVAMREALTRLYTARLPRDGLRIWGFKEVRYDLEDILFFLKLWPRARFVFLHRDIIDMFRSHFIAFGIVEGQEKKGMMDFISKYNVLRQASDVFSEEFPEQSLVLYYEDICREGEVSARRLTDFLGLPAATVDWPRVRSIMSHTVDFIPSSDKAGADVDDAVAAFRALLDTM